MGLLPPMLRYQILEHNAHDTFQKVPLFRFAPEGAKLFLARSMHASTAFAGDVISRFAMLIQDCLVQCWSFGRFLASATQANKSWRSNWRFQT